MKTATRLFLLATLWVLPTAAMAAEGATGGARAAVDLSKWKCELCKFQEGTSGSVDVGGAYVSDSSYKFGEYNGLYEEGGYFLGDFSVRHRGKDGTYLNATGTNLGLDTRSLNVEGGQQGKYKLLLDYNELPHFISDTTQTPFLGNGGSSLTLPGGYPAADTGSMPLATTLHPFDISTKRKQIGLGASWSPGSAWDYGVAYRHETRDGTRGTSGAFFTNAAQLIAPVEYDTDQIDASATYTGAKFQAKFAYYGSIFRDSNSALTFQNPFNPIVAGADAGQLALPPDNQFHQISASLAYQFTERTRGTADIAFGRMTQDQMFLAPTINPNLAVPSLPTSSLDGRVDTFNANVALNSAVTDRLRLNGVYIHNDRDNRTSQAAYTWVTTDMFVNTPTTNLPYSFTQDKLQLRGDYKATQKIKATLGYDYDAYKRTFQEAEKTRDNTIWGKIAARALDNFNLSLKYAYSKRDNNGYYVVPEITPPENPLLRKFNMADRTRNSTEFRADLAATDKINLGLQFNWSDDDYSNSTIGLTSGKDASLGADMTVLFTDDTSMHLYANREIIKSSQAGSQSYSTPDWWGSTEDTINFFGIGVKHAAIKNKLDLGADYVIARTVSEISVNAGAGDTPFPNIRTSRDTLKLYADYHVKDDVSLRLGYWYEYYKSDYWPVDGVAPDTIPNVLTFGQQSPKYNVNVIAISVRYKF